MLFFKFFKKIDFYDEKLNNSFYIWKNINCVT